MTSLTLRAFAAAIAAASVAGLGAMACSGRSDTTAADAGPNTAAPDAGPPDAGPPDAAPDADAPDAPAFTGSPTDNVSGTRVRVRSFVTSDGLKLPMGLFDSKLGVPCALHPMTDGTVRCMPEDTAAVYNASSVDQGLYSDPGCQSGGVVDVQTWDPQVLCVDPTIMVHVKTPYWGSCDHPNVDFFALGPKLAKAYARDTNGQCVQQPATDGMAFDTYFQTGAPIPLASLVAFHETRVPLVPGLDTFAFLGDDGSRFWEDVLVDTAHDARCTLQDLGADGVRCVPRAGFGGLYGDSACSHELYLADCHPSKIATSDVSTSNGCTSTPRVFEVGAAFATAGTFQLGPAGVCMATVPSVPPGPVFDIGAAVPLTSLPTATKRSSSGTRITRDQFFVGSILVADTASPFAPNPLLYDTSETVGCTFTVDRTEATARCLPANGVATGPFFDDAACTQIKGFISSIDTCAPNAPLYGVSQTGTYCAPIDEYHRLGVALTVTSAYYLSTSWIAGQGDVVTCLAYPAPFNASIYDVGPKVDLATANIVVE
jgi:hypothetical protein